MQSFPKNLIHVIFTFYFENTLIVSIFMKKNDLVY